MIQPPGHADTGVVHQDVGNHMGLAGLDDGVAAIRRGKIGNHRSDEVIAGIIDSVAHRGIADIRQYQLRARGAELVHHVPAEAAACAGDKDCLVRWICHGRPGAYSLRRSIAASGQPARPPFAFMRR